MPLRVTARALHRRVLLALRLPAPRCCKRTIETVWARLPLAVLEYPVFKTFVSYHIPHYISLGEVAGLRRMDKPAGLYQLPTDVLERTLQMAITVLRDHAMEAQWVDENFASLRAFCGIDTVSAQYIQIYDRGLKELPEHPLQIR